MYYHLTYPLLAWERSGRTKTAKIKCAHRRAGKLLTDNNHRILTFYSVYDYFTLLKDFNTNTLNFHQYFKDKLSSHQLSHMHNTWHRRNSNFNTPFFNHSKTHKCYLYQIIPIWNSLPNSVKNCTYKFTLKKMKSHLLASQSLHFLNYIWIYFYLSSSPNYFRIFSSQAICIFIIVPIVLRNLVSIKCIIVLLLLFIYAFRNCPVNYFLPLHFLPKFCRSLWCTIL